MVFVASIPSTISLVQPFFQIGIAVRNIEQAMEELGAALGVEWVGPKVREFGPTTLRAAFARTRPPYLELIEGSPGSIWDAPAGSFIHHLGYWSDDLKADAARLEASGVHLELDLGHARYHRGTSSGTRIELIDAAHKQVFLARWGLPLA
jgi:hypothetical protein